MPPGTSLARSGLTGCHLQVSGDSGVKGHYFLEKRESVFFDITERLQLT